MIEFLATSGASPLKSKLFPRIASARHLDVSSAFFSASDEVEEFLQQQSARARVVVRLDYPTNPDAIRDLAALDRAEIRGFSMDADPTFHEKIVIAYRGHEEPIGAYVGSANWTHGGLSSNTEAGVWITEPAVLRQMAAHFKKTFEKADPITETALRELERVFRWHQVHRTPPAKDRGGIRSIWPKLPSGDWILKQNGVKESPFMEGTHSFRDLNGNQCAQTLNGLPKGSAVGQQFVLTYISQRKQGARDRLIYGRGIVGDVDPLRWRLSNRFLDQLRASGIGEEKIEGLRRWPDVIWLSDLDCIDYPPDCKSYLWLSDVIGLAHFRRGYQKLSPEDSVLINRAIDRKIEELGRLPSDEEGIWWNFHLGHSPSSPLYMTKSRMEREAPKGK